MMIKKKKKKLERKGQFFLPKREKTIRFREYASFPLSPPRFSFFGRAIFDNDAEDNLQ